MKTEIDLAHWRGNLLIQQRFANFWSSVSQIKVARDADPKLVAKLVEASERVK